MDTLAANISRESIYTKEMYDAVYSPKARRIGRAIRNHALGRDGNIGQNCILFRKDIDALAEQCGLNKNKRVLDLCCGDGGVDIHFAKKFGCQITGLDFSDVGISEAEDSARRKNVWKNCDFKLGMAEKTPFGNNSFDVIFSFDSFSHIRDKKALLDECFRLLKPGGELVFSDWVDMEEISEDVQRSGELWGYIYLLNGSAYEQLLRQCGFEILKVTDNSTNFKNIIAKWEGVNLSCRDFLIKECGVDYFNKARRRWALARELSQSGFLGQSFFICQKPHIPSNLTMTEGNGDKRRAEKKDALKNMLSVISNFCAFWAVNSGIKSGILEVIAGSRRPITEKKLIERTGYAGRFISSWLRAAYASGIVSYDPKKSAYSLPSGIKNILLDRNDRSYLGGSFAMFAGLADTFKLHPEAMKSGRKLPLRRQATALLKAMAEVTRSDFADLHEPAIRADARLCDTLKAGGEILDVGVGLGLGSIHLSKAYPKCGITGVDLDRRALAIAGKNVRKEKLEQKIKLKLLDAKKGNFKTRFDLVCMNLALHEVGADREERLAFLKKCRGLLKKGGWLLISEMAIPDKVTDCGQVFMKMLMGLEMCESVFGGEMLMSGVLKSLIRKAGFRGLREIAQPDRSRIVLLARR